jgi:tripartite ATP-independent transporter DctM subunit
MSVNVMGLSAAILLICLFLKFPVFIAVLAGSVSYFIFTPGISTQILAQRFIAGMENIPLLAIPFFVCSGVLMNYTGVTRRIMNFCEVITGRMYGGLGHVNILLSTLMGGLSGSNLADAAMEAKMLVPAMEEKGFSKEYSSVVTAVSAMITPLIPPGIAMIIYGSIANVSIGKLFIAGIGPGLLLCAALMVLNTIISRKRKYLPTRTARLTVKELVPAVKPAVLPLCLPIIIIGGIRLGVFTPTEAGAIAIVYALFLGFVYKEMKLDNLVTGCIETVCTTASIMVIIGSASAFAWILTKERVPQNITAYIVRIFADKYSFLMAVNVFMIIVGMFIEGNAAMIVLVPLLAPIAKTYGIPDIQFAMVFIFNLAIGAISPPMGTLMFVTCGITKCKLKDFIVESWPFYIVLLVCLALLTFFPVFSLGVVNLFYQ